MEPYNVPLVTLNHKISLAYVALGYLNISALRAEYNSLERPTAWGHATYFTAPKSSLHMQVENNKTQEAPKLFSNNHSPSIHNRKAINARAFILNHKLAARGTRIIINNDDQTVTFGFKDLQYWDRNSQSYKPFTKDIFYVTADDYGTASFEFYARWATYVYKRFHTPHIPIEVLSTERE